MKVTASLALTDPTAEVIRGPGFVGGLLRDEISREDYLRYGVGALLVLGLLSGFYVGARAE